MKQRKKAKYAINDLFFFCFIAVIFALLPGGAGEDTAGAAEAAASEKLEEAVFQIPEAPGTPGEDGVVLTQVRYQSYDGFRWKALQFVFSDGTAVEWEPFYEHYKLKNVECLDLTGDGVSELLLWGYFVNTAGEYNLLNIFQIDGREVGELSFQEDIAELKDEVCHTNLFYTDRGGRKGYALQVETRGKEGAQIFLEQVMEIYYEGGRWRKLPGRNLAPRVSLESDSWEARIYEAFLRGECSGGESENARFAARYCYPVLNDYEDFCFQDILDGILAGSRGTFETSAPVEKLECERIDCVEYGLLDCGGDGIPELALRVRGVHKYSVNQDCDSILIFGCRDGRVELLFGVDAWEGRRVEICLDGSVHTEAAGRAYSGGGERIFHEVVDTDGGGLAYRSVSDGKIGADGVYKELVEVIAGMGEEVGQMTEYPPLHGEELSADFYQCMLGDKTIYAYRILGDTPGGVLEHIQDYIAENEDRLGVKFFSYETMEALCDAWERKFGLGGWDSQKNRIQWQALQGCEEYTGSEPIS